MGNPIFAEVAMNEKNEKWEQAVKRPGDLYHRGEDYRSEFARDYTRILHSNGYRRMKHKTQVFFNAAGNDHICTRMEHVAHVESVSSTIARSLGLNDELTRAIAMAHDIGHAPFGHEGERAISEITERDLNYKFWHEKNGLRFVDCIELLPNPRDEKLNLDLTFAVRDGIISHCGEVDKNFLRPRSQDIDIAKEFETSGAYEASTWEGCVVKLADKIAYIGRDIEDAQLLGYLTKEDEKLLREIAHRCNNDAVNTTVITHSMISDICKHSTPENGLCFSTQMQDILTEIKAFNYDHIYHSPRLEPYKKYSHLIINTLYDYLCSFYPEQKKGDVYPSLLEKLPPEFGRHEFMKTFAEWLCQYINFDPSYKGYGVEFSVNCKNLKIYEKLQDKTLYQRAVIDFIAGMTDSYAERAFRELLGC